MLGLLLSEIEIKEVEYIVKRELEELLLDLTDERIDGVVKKVMIEKYDIIYNIYKKVAPPNQHAQYAMSLNDFAKKKF
ncbi:hypothetical protein JCM19046_3332 [Bacillus sp. JCM 19046]|uniref:Uncharacterized protein n=1 Tax=Shouchella xiaoxiensis TaxID=766895 RepID=A0ABS2SZA8_9BACI|nr:hypothetical protein [Shouchella xiaoxiensis]MBM7840853.1 hypothetical protein [Shouchella xiaoxiensis]GAF14888.1 hypothetical protein JCM19045_4223 [Bacillus sp. JCM 19045]GAF18743.1 hypothetical protein JCM19046_3332 [Bacillus sp. JCM 19046]